MTHDLLQDDWTQRLKEDSPDPLGYIRQVHEEWLCELEGLAVEAIATHDWSAFYGHIVNFQCEYDLHGEALICVGNDSPCLTVRHTQDEVSADDLHNPGADLSSPNHPTKE